MKVKRPVTNDDLAELLGVTKGTASRKVAALNGVIRKIASDVKWRSAWHVA